MSTKISLEISGHMEEGLYVPDTTKVKAFGYLKSLPRSWLPKSVIKGIREVSNSELKRWLEDKAVVINGKTPKPLELICLPVTSLVFFPKGNRKTTIIGSR